MVTSTIECPACGHEETIHAEQSLAIGDIAIMRCDRCSARVVYGVLLPRVVVEPFTDANGFVWLRQRFQDPRTKADLYIVDLDPKRAAEVATNILSITVGS